MQHILVAAHGGPAADGALRVARALSEREGATVDVLAVLPPFPTSGQVQVPTLMRRPELRRECEEDLREKVRAQIARVVDDGMPPWEISLVGGRPGRAIAAEAERRDVDLVVLGIGKYAPADRVFGGEVALEVARWCSVPVLAVAPGSEGLPHHAVAATDFSQSSKYAARTALELLDPGGRLSLVHVCPDVELPPKALEEWRSEYRRISDALLARTAREVAGDDVRRIEQRLLAGDPPRELISFANQTQADLIATGSHGYHVAERILVGSVATKLLRASHCSVLLAPSSGTPNERAIAWRMDRGVLPGVP